MDKTGAAYGVSEQWATLAPRHEECMFSACEESRIEHSEVEGTKSCHCSASAYATQQIILIDTSCQTKVQQLKLCMSRNFVRPQSQKNSFLSFFLPPRRPLIHVLFATSLLAFEALEANCLPDGEWLSSDLIWNALSRSDKGRKQMINSYRVCVCERV